MPPAFSANGIWVPHADTDPNAHGFDRFYGFHSGCIDYYSHRYYWGEPRIAELSRPLARPHRNLRRRPVHHGTVRARSGAVRPRPSRRPVLPVRAVQCAALSHACAEESTWSGLPRLPPERRTYAAMIAADGRWRRTGAAHPARVAPGRQHAGDLHRPITARRGSRAPAWTASPPRRATTRRSAATSSAPSTAACTCP